MAYGTKCWMVQHSCQLCEYKLMVVTTSEDLPRGWKAGSSRVVRGTVSLGITLRPVLCPLCVEKGYLRLVPETIEENDYEKYEVRLRKSFGDAERELESKNSARVSKPRRRRQ